MHEGDDSTKYIGQDMFMFMFHLQDPTINNLPDGSLQHLPSLNPSYTTTSTTTSTTTNYDQTIQPSPPPQPGILGPATC